jgi:hypothetical protein
LTIFGDPYILNQYIIFEMEYKPYSLEWTRKRYLFEAIQTYFEDDVSSEIVLGDFIDILEEISSKHKKNLERIDVILKGLSK